MKNIMRITFALLLAVILCGGAMAEGLVRYEGGAEDFVFLPGSADSETDLFGEQFKVVLPGDELTQTITVKNTSGGNVRVYMRAEAVSPEDKDFLDQLRLTVTAGNDKIFDAQAGEKAQLADNTLLGTFKKNGSTELTVKLYVPIEMGNEYMDKIGVLPWTFLVEEVKDTTTTPDTGDWFQMSLWLGAAVILLAAIVVVYARRRSAN